MDTVEAIQGTINALPTDMAMQVKKCASKLKDALGEYDLLVVALAVSLVGAQVGVMLENEKSPPHLNAS